MFKIESGVQLLARLTKRPNIANFYPTLIQSGPAGGDVIEIFSDICTSHLLIDIISEALIYTKLKGVPAGILILETDGNFNYYELINALRRKLWTALNIEQNMCSENIELNEELHKTLTNLHIMNIFDETQFYTTVHNLESTLAEHDNISIIIFNTLTSFYWSEQGFKIIKMDLYIKNLLNLIQKIIKDYKVTCIYTRPQYFCSNKDSDSIPTEVNYQIQLLDNRNGNYQVNVKTLKTKSTCQKLYRIINNTIVWN